MLCTLFKLLLLTSAVIFIQVFGFIENNNLKIVYDSFDEYKNSLNKSYMRKFEETRCRRAYEENCKSIRHHNELYLKGKTGFQLRANCLADLNSQQYLKRFVRLQSSVRIPVVDKDQEMVGVSLKEIEHNDIPDSFDWRSNGFETTPDNQKSCGSCYAFSIAQSVEGQIFKRTGKIISLSEQQIVDCSTVTGNHGCSGGSLRNTLKYLQAYGGIMRREDYPYMAKKGKCQFVKELSIVNITSWAILPPRDEEAIKIAIATIGPVAVSINASPKTFQLYSDGVYDDEVCSSKKVNHAMLAIGYTPDYWILKNWWGFNWGDNGYMKIKRNKNVCGLANYAAYAIV